MKGWHVSDDPRGADPPTRSVDCDLESHPGPRYLAISPGDGSRQLHFVGLSDPPVVEKIAPGDLEIVLETATEHGDTVSEALEEERKDLETLLEIRAPPAVSGGRVAASS